MMKTAASSLTPHSQDKEPYINNPIHRKKKRINILCVFVNERTSSESSLTGWSLKRSSPMRLLSGFEEIFLTYRTIYIIVAVIKTTKIANRNSAPERSEEHTSELQSRFDLVC